MTSSASPSLKALAGVRVLSLSLNLPGPAALLRLARMGAQCVKLEPPAPVLTVPTMSPTDITGDPMSTYSRSAYAALHQGIEVQVANLKTDTGQASLQHELAQAQVLLTSFRPGALRKLGLSWDALHLQYPKLSLIAIVGAPGVRAEEPGHDLTYMAENDLITGLDLPATLYADMAGALLASEAVLQAVLLQAQTGEGSYFEVALSDAAAHLALPRSWGLTLPGTAIGGGHAGYKVYACLDGRVALAALEPHFAKSLCQVAGLDWAGIEMMQTPATHQAIAQFVARLSRAELQVLAAQHDIPLHTLSN
jgi:crotonobetainyl-CoA:carnitine CoA-transferase CaiB-like acyl-CoA transferase